MRVFVLLYKVDPDNEGIHTLRIGDTDTILMFENEDDATRFALMLEAQDFAAPTPEAIDSEEIELFCTKAGYEAKIVPAGTLFTPPDRNLEQTDWSPDEPTPAAEPSDLSENELDDIRRRLEGLFNT